MDHAQTYDQFFLVFLATIIHVTSSTLRSLVDLRRWHIQILKFSFLFFFNMEFYIISPLAAFELRLN